MTINTSNDNNNSNIVRSFNQIDIWQKRQDGYINLNQMANATGKRIDHWLENKSTNELFQAFNDKQERTYLNTRDITSTEAQEIKPPIRTIQGRNGSTWAHPDIAIQFAMWCSPEFALQVSEWVRTYMTEGRLEAEESIPAHELKFIKMIEQIEDVFPKDCAQSRDLKHRAALICYPEYACAQLIAEDNRKKYLIKRKRELQARSVENWLASLALIRNQQKPISKWYQSYKEWCLKEFDMVPLAMYKWKAYLIDNEFAQVLKKTGAGVPLEIFPV